jgi:hypothetical protein
MRPLLYLRLLGSALLMVSLPYPLASDTPAEVPKILHKVKFARGGDAGVHCACVTTRSGCDTKLRQPFASDTVHQWWQTVQVETGESVDVAATCWRKRDVPAHGDALCCSPVLTQDGDPEPRSLRNLYGATATREPSN